MRSRPCETPCAGSGGLAQGLSAKQARARQRGSRAGAARSRRHGGNLRLPEVAELVHMARLRVLEQLHSHFTPSTTCSRVICFGDDVRVPRCGRGDGGIVEQPSLLRETRVQRRRIRRDQHAELKIGTAEAIAKSYWRWKMFASSPSKPTIMPPTTEIPKSTMR